MTKAIPGSREEVNRSVLLNAASSSATLKGMANRLKFAKLKDASSDSLGSRKSQKA